MRWLLLLANVFLPTLNMLAADQPYSHDLAEWQESLIPPESDSGGRMAWFYAANYSNLEWRVYLEAGKPSATHSRATIRNRPERPKFMPKAGGFSGGSAFAKVDDGWLVGFNQGEFGAALYWFSNDGERNYKISDHQVVDFVSLPDGIYAVEGLAHLGLSQGSVIRIARTKTDEKWEAAVVTALPFAPYAVSLLHDGTMLIALSDSLVSMGADHKIHTLLADAPWSGLYPNSTLLSADEQRFYIGMRQFVGEFDLKTNRFRLLIPSKEFLNQMPEEDEQRIRKHYGG